MNYMVDVQRNSFFESTGQLMTSVKQGGYHDLGEVCHVWSWLR